MHFVVFRSRSKGPSINDHLREFAEDSIDCMSDSKRTNSSSSFLVIGSEEDEQLERENAFQCGWIHVTADYKESPPDINLSKFSSSAASKTSKPPRSVFFCVLKEQSLYLYEGEAQVLPLCVVYTFGRRTALRAFPLGHPSFPSIQKVCTWTRFMPRNIRSGSNVPSARFTCTFRAGWKRKTGTGRCCRRPASFRSIQSHVRMHSRRS